MEKDFDYYLKTYGKNTSKINDGKFITIDVHDADVIYSKDRNGKWWHRLDGPAYIYFNRTTHLYIGYEWWIDDYEVTTKITDWAKDNDIDLDNLTDVDIALIKITWAG